MKRIDLPLVVATLGVILIGILIALVLGSMVLGAEPRGPDQLVAAEKWFPAGKETVAGVPYSMICAYTVNRKPLARIVREDGFPKLRAGDSIRSTCTFVLPGGKT